MLDSLLQLKWIGQLGIGAVIALVIFYFYRVDRLDGRVKYKEQAELYAKAIEQMSVRHSDLARDFRTIVQDNVRSITDVASSNKELSRTISELRTALLKINGGR